MAVFEEYEADDCVSQTRDMKKVSPSVVPSGN